MDEDEVRKRSRSGTWWTLGGQAVGLVLLLATEAARGRLLSPVELGVFTGALVFTGLVAYLGEFGLGAEVVRRRDLTAAQISAAHRAMIYASVGFGVLAAAGSPLLGWWYGDWDIVPVSQALAWSFVLQGPGMIAKAMLQRDLAFGPLVGGELGGTALNLALVALLAWMGLGVWALVAGMLAGLACRTIVFRVACDWAPERPDWSVFRSLFVEGSRITGSRILFYAQENVDRMLLGRFSGTETLGVYGRAVTLAALPMARITAVFNQVAFPAFAALVTDPPALRRHYLTTLRDISLLAFPAGVGLALVAEEAVLVVYGEAWVAAVPVVRAVGLVAIARSIRVVAPAVFVARGQAGYNLWISVASAAVHTVAFGVGSLYGLVGMAVAFVVAVGPLHLIVVWLSSRAVGVSLTEIGRVLLPSALRAAVMGVVVAGVLMVVPAASSGMPSFLAALLRLASAAASGVLVYGAITWSTSPSARAFVRQKLRLG